MNNSSGPTSGSQNNPIGQQPTTPQDLRNVVLEILQSDEFKNQLRCSIERASSSRVSHNNNSSGLATAAQRISVATPAEELRRLFPSIRGSNDNELLSRNNPNRIVANYVSDRTRKRKRAQKVPLLDFKRDVILLRKQEETRTLTGLQKGSAYANGRYIVSV